MCIWPIKLNNKLGKITQYDTSYIGGVGCDWALSLKQLLEHASKKTYNYTFLWQCNDDTIKQVTILLTVPRCELKSWISDSMQQLVVVQMRCADVKLLWESEREKMWSSWINHVFSDDWFNRIVCVYLFTHITYMLYSINVCRNCPHSKLESCGNDLKLCNIHKIPHVWKLRFKNGIAFSCTNPNKSNWCIWIT